MKNLINKEMKPVVWVWFNNGGYIEALIEELEEHTYITRLENGNILLQVF